MLCGTLCGVEMGLAACRVPHNKNGVGDALAFLTGAKQDQASQRRAA
jgi:hypothetical protein